MFSFIVQTYNLFLHDKAVLQTHPCKLLININNHGIIGADEKKTTIFTGNLTFID